MNASLCTSRSRVLIFEVFESFESGFQLEIQTLDAFFKANDFIVFISQLLLVLFFSTVPFLPVGLLFNAPI